MRIVKTLMARLRSTAEVDRREVLTRRALAAASEDIREAREALSVAAKHIRNLDRWDRLYGQRMADRVDPP